MAIKTQTPQPCKNIQFQLNANTFVRQGYGFLGWNTDFNSTTSQYGDNATLSFDGDTYLYAIWRANAYAVHISNGYGGTLSDMAATFDTAFLVDALVRTGYRFKGWCVTSGLNPQTAKYGTSTSSCNTAISSTATLCANGNPSGSVSFNNLTASDNGQVTITGQWDANTYSVRFNANGGIGTMNPQSFVYDEYKNLSANTFTRAGYTHQGWSTSSTGSKSYNDQANVGNLTATNGGIVDLYAVWSINRYTLALSASPSEGGEVSGGGEFDYGTVQTISASPSPGYEFVSWSDGGAQTHSVAIDSNKTLVATFEENTHVPDSEETPS